MTLRIAETASDASDVEGRIRALNQELMKRKREAEQLKREAKRRDKERLKAHEASLKKQIEVRGGGAGGGGEEAATAREKQRPEGGVALGGRGQRRWEGGGSGAGREGAAAPAG